MMVSQYLEKVKSWVKENDSDLYVALLIFLVGLASFGLGRLSVYWPQKEPITITESPLLQETNRGVASPSASPLLGKGRYVASKSGKYYHYPWCPGAQRIKEENKIWFATKEEAEKRGYRPAANCEGL